MIKITSTIKTLILEFIAGNGSGHIKEIHLKVTEFRPNVPEHTVRARLSEMSRSDNLEEKLSAYHFDWSNVEEFFEFLTNNKGFQIC